jgi:TonB-dependent receptor
MRLLLLLTTLCSIQILSAQTSTGKIAGRVLNTKNDILVGVVVKVDGKKATTDIEGRYIIAVSSNQAHTVSFTFLGYREKTVSEVTVLPGKTEMVDVILDEASNELEKIVVTASSARRETAASLLSLQKNSISVSDGISAESIKRSPDKNTGEVLKRVSGASIEDNKFVIIRGLVDRYNQATINNSLLPSTEADKRAFSFDLIPSNLIDNIVIYKTATPDLPGDFAGGVIQVTTKDVPNARSFNISVGAGFNLQSTFKDFKRDAAKSGMDYLGFDNGNRSIASGIPATRQGYASAGLNDRITFTKQFNNNLSNGQTVKAIPSGSLQLLWNGRKDYKNGGVLGSVLALNYRNTQNLAIVTRNDYEDVAKPVYTLNDSTYKFSTTVGVLANFSYKKGRNKYSFKNLVNKIFDNTFSTRSGKSLDNNTLIKNNYTETFDKLIANSQFGGEHALKASRLDWNLNYTFVNSDRPDFRTMEYNKDAQFESKPEVPYNYNPKNNIRLWSYLNEYAIGGTINYNKPFEWLSQKQNFKIGGLTQYKKRDFKTRWFRLEEAFQSDFDVQKYTVAPDQLLAAANVARDGYAYNEYDDNTDKYDATTFLNAGYVMLDSKLSDKFRAVVGARIESFTAKIETYDRSGSLYKVDNNYLDILPSVNLIYSVSNKSNLRLSASRTVTRPEIRELTYLSYYDYIQNATIVGNPNLKRSQNTNIDLRFETYPTAGEVLSATVFYKHFKNPIESYLMPGSNISNRIVGWINSPEANTYGIELEFRKKLGFLSTGTPWLDNLTFFANGAYIKSASDRVVVDGNGIATATGETKPMQGQSNYLVNAGLQYTTPSSWAFSLLYNRSGYRLATIGNEFFEDLFENGRSILDFQVAKRLNSKSELRISASDLLNQRSLFYYNYDNKYGYQKGKDDIFSSFRYGTNITVTYNYSF